MTAHQAPPSLGFSRQEHWSGLPFPSPMQESEKWKWNCSVVSDFSRPHGLQPTRLLHPWDFPGKSTGVGCHCLLHIYREFHPKTVDFTFFISAHGTFSRIDHILGHKSSLGKFLKNEIISSILSNHSIVRLDVYYRGKNYTKYKHMEAKQYASGQPRGH